MQGFPTLEIEAEPLAQRQCALMYRGDVHEEEDIAGTHLEEYSWIVTDYVEHFTV